MLHVGARERDRSTTAQLHVVVAAGDPVQMQDGVASHDRRSVDAHEPAWIGFAVQIAQRAPPQILAAIMVQQDVVAAGRNPRDAMGLACCLLTCPACHVRCA